MRGRAGRIMRAGGRGGPYGGTSARLPRGLASLGCAPNIPPPFLHHRSVKELSHASPGLRRPVLLRSHIRAGSKLDLSWTGADWAGPLWVRSVVAGRPKGYRWPSPTSGNDLFALSCRAHPRCEPCPFGLAPLRAENVTQDQLDTVDAADRKPAWQGCDLDESTTSNPPSSFERR